MCFVDDCMCYSNTKKVYIYALEIGRASCRNLGIFAMFVVDAWMCCSNAKKFEETQEAYYLTLSEEMIDNLLDDNLVTRIRKRGDKTRDVMTSPNPLIDDNRGLAL